MRLTPFVLCLGLATSSVSVALPAAGPVAGAAADAAAGLPRGDAQILPRSVAIKSGADAALAAGRLIDADAGYETALAVDPRNRAAFNGLARVAIRQKLFGSAIRYTTKALSLEPTDREALLVQGEAMVELGALPRARDNLARLQKLCGSCGEGGQLSALIARGPSVAAATKTSVTPAVTKKN